MILEHEEKYRSVKALLVKHAVDDNAKIVLAPRVAKYSLMMNHLYADLGFKSRTEMGKFMKLNFPVLAAEKPKDKLWKKYLYDCIGDVAPACATCDDQITCFTCQDKELSL